MIFRDKQTLNHNIYIIIIIIIIIITRSYAALWAADLEWIVGPGYSLGGYILGCSLALSSDWT